MKIHAIQWLRALAALLVAIHHGQGEAAALAVRTGQPFVPLVSFPFAAGVDVFFVISGFIIATAGRDLFGRPGARADFLAHRVARVVPLYWLATLLYLALALAMPGLVSGGLAGGGPAPGFVAASFLFWPALRPDGTAQPLFGLGWTLNYEMLFYALFAVVLGAPRRAALVGLVLALAGLAVLPALVPGLPMPLAFWADPIVLEFALGLAIAQVRLRVTAPASLRLALAACGGVGLALGAGLDPAGFARLLAWGLPAALLVAAAALGPAPSEPNHSEPDHPVPGHPVPGHPLARFGSRLGDASYALYLVHPFALRGIREILMRAGLAPVLGPWLGLVLMLAGSIAAALAVHRLVEVPLNRHVRALIAPAPG